ncbi:MAG: beta-1,6-N-acetylglucosaminyltransferase, partial [Bacteroidota bacterium]
FEAHGGSTWWGLNRECVDYMLENDRRQFQYINMVKMPAPENGKPLSRIQNYHVDYNRRSKNTLQRWFYRGIEEALKYIDFCKKLDFEAHGGSTWWGLNRECVDYILDFVDENPEFVKIFKTTAHPDEAFFQTIIANSPYKDYVKPSLTYAAWPEEEAQSPEIIKKKELIMFRDHLYVETSYGPTVPVFARKFNEVNTFLCEVVDRHLNDFGRELALYDTYQEHEKAYFFQDSVIQEQIY